MNAVSTIQRYGLAVISCGVALPVVWPIDAPASCLLLAVMVSSLFGGLEPGLLSVALSGIAYEHFFLWRAASPAHEPAAFLRFAVLLAATSLVSGLVEVKRRAEQSRTRAEEALR
jgi:K+-sensing histidine kinase KdpD